LATRELMVEGVGPRRAQVGAALAIPVAHRLDVERPGLVAELVEQPLPAVVDAERLDAQLGRLPGDRANRRVQSRRVSTAGENAEALDLHWVASSQLVTQFRDTIKPLGAATPWLGPGALRQPYRSRSGALGPAVPHRGSFPEWSRRLLSGTAPAPFA